MSSDLFRSSERPELISRRVLLATTLFPEQAKPSRSITRMVPPIRRFYLGKLCEGRLRLL